MKKINIAIDGHSSCGKSTIAKQLAQYFGYIYIDTGAMYRGICLYCLQKDIIKNGLINKDLLLNDLDKIEVSFIYNKEKNISETYLNGVNCEKDIRGLWVSDNVSKVSKIKEVRKKMVSIQKKIGFNKGVVMDGRDIGTVVFPDAELKFFITASLKERSRRRYAELEGVSLSDVMKNLEERDLDDSTRIENPLKKAFDAIVVDNTNMTMEEQLNIVLAHCHKVIN